MVRTISAALQDIRRIPSAEGRTSFRTASKAVINGKCQHRTGRVLRPAAAINPGTGCQCVVKGQHNAFAVKADGIIG